MCIKLNCQSFETNATILNAQLYLEYFMQKNLDNCRVKCYKKLKTNLCLVYCTLAIWRTMADSGRLPQKYYFIKKVYIICHDKMEGLIIQGNLGTHLALKCDLVKLTLRSRHAHTQWKVESTLGLRGS